MPPRGLPGPLSLASLMVAEETLPESQAFLSKVEQVLRVPVNLCVMVTCLVAGLGRAPL